MLQLEQAILMKCLFNLACVAGRSCKGKTSAVEAECWETVNGEVSGTCFPAVVGLVAGEPGDV